MKIEFLCARSTGKCDKCAQFYETVLTTISDLKLNGAVQLLEINDIDHMLQMQAYMTPALTIDGTLVSRGRFLDGEQIRQLIVERL